MDKKLVRRRMGRRGEKNRKEREREREKNERIEKG